MPCFHSKYIWYKHSSLKIFEPYSTSMFTLPPGKLLINIQTGMVTKIWLVLLLTKTLKYITSSEWLNLCCKTDICPFVAQLHSILFWSTGKWQRFPECRRLVPKVIARPSFRPLPCPATLSLHLLSSCLMAWLTLTMSIYCHTKCLQKLVFQKQIMQQLLQ